MDFGDSAIVVGQQLQPWQRIRAAIEGYANAIVPLIAASYGRNCIQQAWREFTLGGDTTFSVDDPNTELFFSWLFHRWSPTRRKGVTITDERFYGVAPTRAYLAANEADLDPLLREYLEACLVAPLGVYQVLDCRPGVGFDARDLWSEQELEVSEGLASVSLTSGDIIFAHLPSVEAIVLVDAISPFGFPPAFATRVRTQRGSRRLRKPTDLAMRRLYFSLLQSYLRSGTH